MEFRELTVVDCEKVRQWRNRCMIALRTPFMLTQEMQEDFYKNTVCNRNSKARFWGIWIKDKVSSTFIGMCGLENIEWENSCAEISIILNPDLHGKGFGSKAMAILFEKGFSDLGLKTIYGEVYECNPALHFWMNIIEKYNVDTARLPNRKLWKGNYYDSLYFSIDKEVFYEQNNTRH